jgi:hypothetical protein
MDDALRHGALLAAALFTILATGAALLLPRRAALAAVAGLVVITSIALHVWHSRRVPTAEPAAGVTGVTD